MPHSSFENLILYHILDGLADGLSHYSGPSRAAVVFRVREDDPLRVCDPQFLLDGHEPKLGQYFLGSKKWRGVGRPLQPGFVEEINDPDFDPVGLITYAGRSESCTFQMWFTEHHPDLCCAGPTRRWLEHAVGLVSQHLATRGIMCPDTSGYLVREYSAHAVRDFIVDERNRIMGWDTRLRIYPALDAVLGISKTMEEGQWPRGRLVFVEPSLVRTTHFMARFPSMEQPRMSNFKHVRKLLQVTEDLSCHLVSDGVNVVGVSNGRIPRAALVADYHGGYGYLHMDGTLVCSFADGRFSSSTRRAKLVHLEEILLESRLDQSSRYMLFQIVQSIVHHAQDTKHGCTIVIDLGVEPLTLAGQHMDVPLDLVKDYNLDLAKSLARVDGALHIGADLKLHGFGCLLDGHTVPGENRARGARFNSSLRFTAENPDMVAVVVSSDRPTSIMQHGVELTAVCEWRPLAGQLMKPPLLEDWVAG